MRRMALHHSTYPIGHLQIAGIRHERRSSAPWSSHAIVLLRIQRMLHPSTKIKRTSPTISRHVSSLRQSPQRIGQTISYRRSRLKSINPNDQARYCSTCILYIYRRTQKDLDHGSDTSSTRQKTSTQSSVRDSDNFACTTFDEV